MSHTTEFKAPGWGLAVLIHDGYGMPGTVELRAWLPRAATRCGHITMGAFTKDGPSTCGLDVLPGTGLCEAHLGEPDLLAFLDEGLPDFRKRPAADGLLLPSLLYRAGLVVGASRLESKITDVLEGHEK